MKKKPDDKSELGISRAVYALGNSVKDALIWGTAATVATIAILSFGREKSPRIDKIATALETFGERNEERFQKIVKWVNDKTKSEIKITGPTLAASAVVGWAVGHLVQLPGSIKGWKQAQKANDKYVAVATEKNRLLETNAHLVDENQHYKTELKKRDISFAELVKKPAEAETSMAANSR